MKKGKRNEKNEQKMKINENKGEKQTMHVFLVSACFFFF